MAADIFEFWSKATEGCSIHPADKAVWERVGPKFDPDCLPSPYSGPLKTAKVVLLLSSPGLGEDDFGHAKSDDGRNYYLSSWSGGADLPTEKEHPGYFRWINKSPVLKQFGMSYEQATSTSAIAILNIGSYHSKKLKDREMLAALPSSRIALSWAQTVLFPKAERGETVVVCLRAHRWWGLTPNKQFGSSLFSPKTVINGQICESTDPSSIGGKAIDAVRKALHLNETTH